MPTSIVNSTLPNRWLPDSKLQQHTIKTFISFSVGPANCVGKQFAKCELFTVLVVLFKSFDPRFADGFDSEA